MWEVWVKYLKIANELGLCEYDSLNKKQETLLKNHYKNPEISSKPIVCIQDKNVFKNSRILQNVSSEIYNIRLNYKNVWAVCNGKQYTTKGLTFAYITRSEFNKVKEQSPEKAFGDFFIKE